MIAAGGRFSQAKEKAGQILIQPALDVLTALLRSNVKLTFYCKPNPMF